MDSDNGGNELGPRIREIRRQRGLKQHQLASACGISASYVGLMETGRRKIDKNLFERICGVLEVGPAEVEELVESTQPRMSSIQADARVKRILENACGKLHAKSATFYVEDPFWTGEWRLVAMPGVEIKDPMFGFVSPEGTRRVLVTGDCEFCSDTRRSTDRRDLQIKLPSTIKEEHRKLFSDFVDREDVRASARLLIREGGKVTAILFVNFAVSMDFTEGMKATLNKLREELRTEVPALARMLSIQDAPKLQQTLNLLKPMQEWVERIERAPQTLSEYLGTVLDNVMTVMDMDTGEGFATIHLYRPDDDDLFLVAHRGAMEDIGRAQIQSVVNGDGIISWVAMRQRAIVLTDVDTSKFRPIFVPVRKGIKSVIAVPMMVGQSFAGVLNLESTIQNRFTNQDVRALWYAAGNAGAAARLHWQATTNRKFADIQTKMLRWFCLGVSTSQGQRDALTALAENTGALLDADQCDLWGFDSVQDPPFRALGDSYGLKVVSGPREKGWSEYVCRSKCAVWIGNIQAKGSLDVSFWKGGVRKWERNPPRSEMPESLNLRVFHKEYEAELGLPIVNAQECVGVAWLKFKTRGQPRPGHSEMLMAEQFAESAGRLLKSFSSLSSKG